MAFITTAAMRVSGIYEFLNTVNGKRYIGSSGNIQHRVLQHLSMLRSGEHHNAHFLAAFRKYGEAAFVIRIVETCPVESILSREQHHIDTLSPAYNILPIAGNSTGYRHGPEARAKMSQQRIGNTRMLGKHHSDETRRKLSSRASQRPINHELLARMCQGNIGNKHTAGRPLTQDHRAKVSAGLKGAWDSESRSREAAAERLRARWADPVWKAQQLQKIAAAKAAKRAAHGME